jgi:hypothetical protein
MLKPKSSQSSGCTHIHRKSLNVCWKADGNCFLGRERSSDGGIIVTRDHNDVTSVLQNTKKLHRAIQNKRLGMLISGVVLLLGNAHPHTAARTQALLQHFNWELFDHPPYSPGLTLSDYHLFTYLKNWLRSQWFYSNEELMVGDKTYVAEP